jgi:hypothetical protein
LDCLKPKDIFAKCEKKPQNNRKYSNNTDDSDFKKPLRPKKRLIKSQKTFADALKCAKTDMLKLQEPGVQMRKPILGKRPFTNQFN